jgi:beta-glucanase (GH16 family)
MNESLMTGSLRRIAVPTSDSKSARRHHRARLLTAGTVLLAGALFATAAPADAAVWWWPWPTTTKAAAPTTTTTAPTTTTTTAPTTTTTALLEDGDCGATVLKADGTPWQCTMAENFNGSSLDRDRWFVQTSAVSGFGSQDDCYMDSPDNVAVKDGSLELTVRKEAAPFTCTTPKGSYSTQYSSGTINTYTKWSQAFGRFEFRAKFPSAKAKGLHGALWLWPDNATKYGAWPRSGEIDVAEVYSQFNDRAIPYVHYWTNSTKVTNNYCMLKVDDWHTYVVEWTKTNIKISYDGVVCVDEKINGWFLAAPAPFDQPFMVALTQGLGVQGNRLDPAKPPAFPATLQVDYVHVWQ